MNKKFTAFLLCLLITFAAMALAACSTEDKTDIPDPTMPPAVTAVPKETPAPTPTPEDTQAPEKTSGFLEESAEVDASYFDDTAFVGDSVSLKLSYYAASSGELGKAQFFTAGSLGCANALWEILDKSVHPSYQGQKTLIEDCIQKSGVKKVYIMLGMNDIGLYGIDDTIENYKTLVGKILEKSPDVKIIVESMTPMTSTSTIIGKGLNNDNIKEYNKRLLAMCEENGWYYTDVASVMYSSDGQTLKAEYCSDPTNMGVHFTEAGCKAWIEYLKKHSL